MYEQNSIIHNENKIQYSDYSIYRNEEQNIDINHVLPAQLASRYQVIKELGHGAQGTVYLAINVVDQSFVAIKVLKIQSVKNWKQYDLFHREADVLSRLNIDGVAKLREACEFLDEAVPVALIVQDYIEGDSLQSFIAKGHRFRFSQICQIILQLISILKQLNDCDPPIVHRDIKPSNIIVQYDAETNEPKIHLIDFGAVANPQVKSGGSTVVGTYGYMAPEQLMGHATPKSDVYSLAIIAVYLMSGIPPEDLEIQDYHVLIDAHLEHLPHPVTTALRAMLAPNQDERLTDYDILNQIFTALALEKFNEIPSILGDTQLTCQTEYSLKNVYDFQQPGNIELWQSLSDSTPREIPKIKIKFEFWNTYAGLLIIFIFSLATIIYLIVNTDVSLAICVIPLIMLIIIISTAITQFIERNAKKYFLKYARLYFSSSIRRFNKYTKEFKC